MGLAKRYFPYNLAAQMFLRPLNLGPWYTGITVPLVSTVPNISFTDRAKIDGLIEKNRRRSRPAMQR